MDDSKTRIFGKLDMENAVKEEQKKAEEAPKAETAETAPEAGQETIRLSGEDVQKLKTQVREDHFGVKGKKRDEIKPMKKGLFGFGKKNDDDDFLIDSDDDGMTTTTCSSKSVRASFLRERGLFYREIA